MDSASFFYFIFEEKKRPDFLFTEGIFSARLYGAVPIYIMKRENAWFKR